MHGATDRAAPRVSAVNLHYAYRSALLSQSPLTPELYGTEVHGKTPGAKNSRSVLSGAA